MNSSYKSVRELLDNAIDVHRLSSLLYRGLRDYATDERCRLLLQDMADNEQRLAGLVGEFSRRADGKTLDTRMQYTLEEAPGILFAEHTPHSMPASLPEVVRLGQQLHQYQIDMMEVAVREAASQEAVELLENLLQLEKAEGIAFIRKADSLHDM